MSNRNSDHRLPLDEETRVTANVDGGLNEFDGDIQPGNYSSEAASDIADENELYADLAETGVEDELTDELAREELDAEAGSATTDIDEETLESEVTSLDFDDQRDLEKDPRQL
ncbi:hypothetical protein [Carnimonas nigrificans]|uniref:hypothetical protein n=1 Tax=Carnimonas nigrificans TaxID=64323 RepID=UPI00047270A1|nr:hypothetical protein [Carnimonas nigrificans]